MHDEVARGLGYFSIALGVAELSAPGAICRAAGIAGQEGVVRAYGTREIATGVAILASHDPTPWIWGGSSVMRSTSRPSLPRPRIGAMARIAAGGPLAP
jgi:hypothetical protein